jgi:hypothetical protein
MNRPSVNASCEVVPLEMDPQVFAVSTGILNLVAGTALKLANLRRCVAAILQCIIIKQDLLAEFTTKSRFSTIKLCTFEVAT